MSLVTYNYPTRIVFGPGARQEVVGALRDAGKTRPLFLTDTGVAALEFFTSYVEEVSQAGFVTAVYTGVAGNPVVSQVTGGVEAFRAHNADSLILMGGGAALDVGKAVALMAHHPGHIFDYEDDKPGALPVDKEIPFIIALPTTSGTGSEVGRSSVISDDTTHVKRIIFSPRLLPPLVLADPELTVGLPASVTAATGVDALSHCVEAFLAKGRHPMADGIALEGMHLIARSLVRCVKAPTDIQARGDMTLAAMMGAVAFQKGLGVVHSCAHALSAVCDLHHGLANALTLVPCLRFNEDTVDPQYVRMAQAVGTDATAQGFIGWVEKLLIDLHIPKGLGAVGVKEEHVPALVDIAIKDVCHGCNVKPVSREDFEKLFRAAL